MGRISVQGHLLRARPFTISLHNLINFLNLVVEIPDERVVQLRVAIEAAEKEHFVLENAACKPKSFRGRLPSIFDFGPPEICQIQRVEIIKPTLAVVPSEYEHLP